MIPNEILERFNVPNISDMNGVYNNPEESQCLLFLEKTDYIIIKAYERLMSDNTNFFDNLSSMYEEELEVMRWRIYAREVLNNIGQNNINNSNGE